MNSNDKVVQLTMRILNFLRGDVDADFLTYVTAEIAYLLSQLRDKQISDESEFYDFILALDCSLELKESLCEDAKKLGLWKTLRAYQGMFSSKDSFDVIAECANHAEVNNFSVPASIVPLIVKVLSSEPGGLMADLACGRGTVIAEALKQDLDLKAVGVDINQRTVNFAEMAVSPYGGRGLIKCESAFDYVENQYARYDKVFCYPPFGLRAERNSQFEKFQKLFPESVLKIGAGTQVDLLFALAAIYSMKDTGRSVVMLPEGSLSSLSSGAVAARNFMVQYGNLDCVIKLPERMLERTSINVSLLVFSKKESRSHIRMIDASALAVKGRRFNTIAPDNIDRIVSAVYGFADWSGWGVEHTKNVSIEEIINNGCVLSATRYFTAGDLPEIENAVRFGDGACYYLSPGNIINGIISDDLTGMKDIPKGAPILEEGDLVMLRTGAPNKVAVFEGCFDKPVVASSNLFICRFDKTKVDPWFLKAFFESKDGERSLSLISVGTAIRSISRKALEGLSIPCPPLEKQRAIAKEYCDKMREIRDLEKRLVSLRSALGTVYDNGK